MPHTDSQDRPQPAISTARLDAPVRAGEPCPEVRELVRLVLEVARVVEEGADVEVLAYRPTLEVVLGVLFAQASLLITGSVQDLWMYVPSMVVGGIWGLLHTALNPLTRAAELEKERLRRQKALHRQKEVRVVAGPQVLPTTQGWAGPGLGVSGCD